MILTSRLKLRGNGFDGFDEQGQSGYGFKGALIQSGDDRASEPIVDHRNGHMTVGLVSNRGSNTGW